MKVSYPNDMELLSRLQKSPVSFSNENFANYIDPKIRNLVLDFINAGYLPISSCEGHGLFEPRYIVLAFTDLTARGDFIKTIESLQGQIQWQEFETCTYEVINGIRYEYGSIANEIKGLNYIFSRKECFYCFLKIIIGREVSSDKEGEETFPKKIRFSWLLHKAALYNFIFRERITYNLKQLIKNIKN